MVVLNGFLGLTGYVTDDTFKVITETLENTTSVVDEQEFVHAVTGLIVTKYKDEDTPSVYELWYQVRTPNSPEGMDYAFGFDLAAN